MVSTFEQGFECAILKKRLSLIKYTVVAPGALTQVVKDVPCVPLLWDMSSCTFCGVWKSLLLVWILIDGELSHCNRYAPFKRIACSQVRLHVDA